MELKLIFVLIGLFVVLSLIRNARIRELGLIFLSTAFPFVFQSTVPIRNFSFWFPFLSIFLTIALWVIFRERVSIPEEDSLELRKGRFDRKLMISLDFALILLTIILIVALRPLGLDTFVLKAVPPLMGQAALPLICAILALVVIGLGARTKARGAFFSGFIALILAFLLIQKTEFFAEWASRFLRISVGQGVDSAAGSDLRWFGYSYISFRLLSVAIEARKGRKFAGTPGQFLIYVCFPATLAAGPIDRYDRFYKELVNDQRMLDEDWYIALERITLGLFKKFILADMLSYVSLSAQNAPQFLSAGWAWLSLYAYAFQIYLDFAGYSDIAIGLGRILGFRIPENFNAPYLKRNIALFWNNWHMTLTGWIRNYCFNPLTRSLRKKKLPQWLMILAGQLVTMILIGLWHGVTVNFLIWGVWNALALFVHQLYADRLGKRVHSYLESRKIIRGAYAFFATFLTFNVVSFGWVFFTLPSFDLALTFIHRLFS